MAGWPAGRLDNLDLIKHGAARGSVRRAARLADGKFGGRGPPEGEELEARV